MGLAGWLQRSRSCLSLNLPRQKLNLCALATFVMLLPCEAEDLKERPVKAYIVDNPNKLVPESVIQLGSVDTSATLAAKVLLHNATSKAVTYDRIESACGCRKIFPESARIAPGTTLELNVELETERSPQNEKGGGRFLFYRGSELVLEASIAYAFTRHVGSPLHMINVSFGESSPIERFDIPFNVGEELPDDAYLVELEGEGATFEYSVDRDKGTLSASIELDEPEKFQKLFGTLRVVNLATGDSQSIPVLLEREVPVKLHPRTLRFVPVEEGSHYVAILYIRAAGEDLDRDYCRVSGKVGGSTLGAAVTRIGDRVFKARFSLSESEVRDFLGESSEAKSKRQQTVQVSVNCGGDTVSSRLPLIIGE